MDQDSDPDGMKESAVNRQTALLSLDVLARVLGRRHQGAFEGVLGDVTEIVAGVGPGALPGKLYYYKSIFAYNLLSIWLLFLPIPQSMYTRHGRCDVFAVIRTYHERLRNETRET